MFVRTPGGWVTVPWIHQAMAAAPFADVTWRHARHLAAGWGLDDTSEADVARVLDELLSRAQAGPATRSRDRHSDKIAGRTKAAAATRRPPPHPGGPEQPAPTGEAGQVSGEVIPFGIFDAADEAEKWA